jgi:hypothetical protein
MAERVEAVKVPAEVTLRRIERMSPEKHAAGLIKAAEIGSWETGIRAREHKLQRVDKSGKFMKALMDEFAKYCDENKLTRNWTVGGAYAKAVALLFKFGEKAADLYVNTAIPQAYRGFWPKAKQMFKNVYAEVRQ